MSDNVFSATISPSIINNGSGIRKTLYGSQIDSYSHTITALGGYNTAQMTIKIKESDLYDFMTRVLGNEVKVYTEQTEQIWEGFINEIAITYNGIDIRIGPLMDVANKVLVKYSDFTTGQPGVTTYANKIISQLRNGTFTKILSSSAVSATNANNIRNHYLKENAFPAVEIGLSLEDQGSFLVVNLNCLGYYHILENFAYNKSATSTTTWTLREKIVDILASEPLDLFPRTGLIRANSLSVAKKESEDRMAWDIIKELVALGGATNNERMLFGVYNNRSVVYKAVDRRVNFYYKSQTSNKYIRDIAGNKLNIASLKPGQFVAVTDIPDILFADIDSVPRNVFVESVTFTAPFGLTITGVKLSTLAQRLAKLGISGI